MNSSQIIILIVGGCLFLVLTLIVAIGDSASLKSIKRKEVGNGQHGTARFATRQEIRNTYVHIADMDYRTELLAVLIPMQQNYANEAFGYSSSEDSESISEESDTEETEGLSMKM